MMPKIDSETIGPLLHGTARAWRLKLDERLKPMGLSQAKWRTLLHLSVAPGPLTQAEIAALLGIEEPTLVTLLHRPESDRWVARKSSSQDRRCNTVHLAPHALRQIEQINMEALEFRHGLHDDTSSSQHPTSNRSVESVLLNAKSVDENEKQASV